MNWRSHRDWMKIIREWEKTDMPKTEFCKKKNLSIPCFSYHFYKGYKTNEHKFLDKKSFAKVVCKNEPSAVNDVPVSSNGSFYLHLDCGKSIEVPDDFNEETLVRLLKLVVKL